MITIPITSSAAMTVPSVENPVSCRPTSLVGSQPFVPDENRQGIVESRQGVAGRRNLADRHLPSKLACNPGQPVGVVEGQEGGQGQIRPAHPGGEGQLAADAGRLSHGDGQRPPCGIVRRGHR